MVYLGYNKGSENIEVAEPEDISYVLLWMLSHCTEMTENSKQSLLWQLRHASIGWYTMDYNGPIMYMILYVSTPIPPNLTKFNKGFYFLYLRKLYKTKLQAISAIYPVVYLKSGKIVIFVVNCGKTCIIFVIDFQSRTFFIM